ncbi:MAG: DUF3048 domain-containing protein [Patescibacteria group bacterium]
MDKRKLVIGIVGGLGLYLISTGLSYAAFSFSGTKTTEVKSPVATGKKGGLKRVISNLPRTEECPLDGTMYTKDEKAAWDKRRPLGVMIENSKAARPQSGLSYADIVYEAVAEGGISRFMAVFYCQDGDIVGPVRSARTYYLDWISEYGSSPLYAHVGGANTPGPADALGQIERYGWSGDNDLNQFSIGFPTFYRDYERLGKDTATEHTVYTTLLKLWDFAAKKRELTNDWATGFIPWSFKEEAALTNRPASLAVDFGLPSVQTAYAGSYLVSWKYDRETNLYLRFNGGEAHKDLDTEEQITAKNVVLQFMTMGIADDGYLEDGHGSHTLYGTKGTGKAKFLMDGQVIDGTWVKKTRTDRTKFFDTKGVEIKFNRGTIWIEALPIGQQVDVK